LGLKLIIPIIEVEIMGTMEKQLNKNTLTKVNIVVIGLNIGLGVVALVEQLRLRWQRLRDHDLDWIGFLYDVGCYYFEYRLIY
jgi:hypothetical protein